MSMTLGYVLKCNYNLPYNASDYKRDYVRQQELDQEIHSQEMSKGAQDKAHKHGKLQPARTQDATLIIRPLAAAAAATKDTIKPRDYTPGAYMHRIFHNIPLMALCLHYTLGKIYNYTAFFYRIVFPHSIEKKIIAAQKKEERSFCCTSNLKSVFPHPSVPPASPYHRKLRYKIHSSC